MEYEKHYADFSWIKIKKYVDDEKMSFEDRHMQLEKHHQKETKFLIAEIRKLAKIIDSLNK